MTKKQSSQYDKILKENIEAVIPALMKKVLGITAVGSEELPDDVLHTKERKPDVLKKITDEEGDIFILQIEFQVSDEMEMVYRMAEYFIMLERKYKLPVRQFVIFLRSGSPKMPTRLIRERMKFDFPLIAFSELDYQIFLKSNKPEEVVLAVLADFKQQNSETAVIQIIKRIRETAVGDFALSRYFRQLRILAQLRNLGENLNDIPMENLLKYVSIERDPFYKVGVEKGEAKGEARAKRTFIHNLLTRTTLTPQQIADVAGVAVELVDEVKAEISAGK